MSKTMDRAGKAPMSDLTSSPSLTPVEGGQCAALVGFAFDDT